MPHLSGDRLFLEWDWNVREAVAGREGYSYPSRPVARDVV